MQKFLMVGLSLIAVTLPYVAHGQDVKARHFANVGAFEIVKLENPTRCIAGRLDYSRSVTMLFEINPRHRIVLTAGKWSVPTGVYPVVISFKDAADGMPHTINASGNVPEGSQGKAFVMQFQTAFDVEKLVDEGWLGFDIGPQNYMFNMGASDAVRELEACAQNDTDPFASMR